VILVSVSGILSGSLNPLAAGLALARAAARIQPLRPVAGIPGHRPGESPRAALSPADALFEVRDVVELTGPHVEAEQAGPRHTAAGRGAAGTPKGQDADGYVAVRFRSTPYPAAQFIDTLA
jgi:hypothetical protein